MAYGKMLCVAKPDAAILFDELKMFREMGESSKWVSSPDAIVVWFSCS